MFTGSELKIYFENVVGDDIDSQKGNQLARANLVMLKLLNEQIGLVEQCGMVFAVLHAERMPGANQDRFFCQEMLLGMGNKLAKQVFRFGMGSVRKD